MIVVISRLTGLLLFTLLPQRSVAYTAESARTSRFSGPYDKQAGNAKCEINDSPLNLKPGVRKTSPYGFGVGVYTL